jgi:phage gp29-like protein
MKRYDSKTYREGSVRSFVEWTPGLLRSAQHMADGGQLRLAADLCEALLGDSRVQGVLGTRVLGLLGLPLHFTPADESLAAGKATKALEQDFWKAFPEADLAQLVSWGVLLGVGVGEIIWEPQGERVIPRLKVWHPRWLRWDWEQRKWFLALDGGAEVPIEPGANKWILFTPYGAWRACAQPWLMKQLAVQDWARHAEVHGSPVRVGTAPEGASAEVRAQVAADFAKLGADTAICLPAGFDLRFEEASGGSWQMFKAELDWCKFSHSNRFRLRMDQSGSQSEVQRRPQASECRETRLEGRARRHC